LSDAGKAAIVVVVILSTSIIVRQLSDLLLFFVLGVATGWSTRKPFEKLQNWIINRESNDRRA